MSTQPNPDEGLILLQNFVQPREKSLILGEISQLQPVWEDRYQSEDQGQSRQLLRPVYWLGSWQFAKLNYYHPPSGIEFRCAEAEPFPQGLKALTQKIELHVRRELPRAMVPSSWELNTCLINFYGARLIDDKWVDGARVGEHRDYEPGPVASVSFGEKALFQFVSSRSRKGPSRVIRQFWLDDSSLQVFAGETWKRKLFHRVQRVARNHELNLATQIPHFRTRRINLTLRYVPREHVRPLGDFPASLASKTKDVVLKLAGNSDYFHKTATELRWL